MAKINPLYDPEIHRPRKKFRRKAVVMRCEALGLDYEMLKRCGVYVYTIDKVCYRLTGKDAWGKLDKYHLLRIGGNGVPGSKTVCDIIKGDVEYVPIRQRPPKKLDMAEDLKSFITARLALMEQRIIKEIRSQGRVPGTQGFFTRLAGANQGSAGDRPPEGKKEEVDA